MLMTKEKITKRFKHLNKQIEQHMVGVEYHVMLEDLFEAHKVHQNMYGLPDGEFHSCREAVLFMLAEVQAAVHTAKSNHIDDRIEDEES